MVVKIRVGITMGDPSGIGPAILVKALPRLSGLAEVVIIGDRRAWDKAGGSKIKVNFVDLNNCPRDFRFGQVRAEYGRASVEYLNESISLIDTGKIDCLVTCPISKEAVNLAGFKYPGHTEYLAQRAGVKDCVMMLLNDRLRFSLVTRHISLSQVAFSLNSGKICQNICLAHKGLKELFKIKHPRIVCCGLNPHASDNGLLGGEENKVIKPALKKLRERSRISVDGPVSADVAVALAASGAYDCAIAMYHDQAMIPLKLYGNNSGVNLTLGLPYVRTSPLHGTAFDIAKIPNLACPDSLIAAVQTAVQCVQNQRKA